MRAFLSLIAAILLMNNHIYAQDTLFVKQVPLGSSLSVFSERLLTDGLVYNKELSENGYSTFNGAFMGRDAIVSLEYDKNESVYRVIVIHQYDNWTTLVSGYSATKKKYSQKYGKPTQSLEQFYSPYREGDGLELNAIVEGKCVYSCFWELKAGSIAIAISSTGNDFFVAIAYVSSKHLSETEEQAYNDI